MATTSTSTLPSLRRRLSPSLKPPQSLALAKRLAPLHVALHADAPSSAPPLHHDPSPSPKVGTRIRVTAPLRVHHVAKAPELDLMGMEGRIKQYVGAWKGKRVSANLPFKVEFVLNQGPVRFFAHLRDTEFEILSQD